MSITTIDKLLKSEADEYMFVAIIGDAFYVGINVKDGHLYDMLHTLYEEVPDARPDMIDFAADILGTNKINTN